MWRILQQEKPDDYVLSSNEAHTVREFLHVDDMADACVYLMNNYDGLEHVNIETGEEISIKELALLIKKLLDMMESLNLMQI